MEKERGVVLMFNELLQLKFGAVSMKIIKELVNMLTKYR